MIVCYRAHEIPEIWYEVEPLIKKALDRGNYTLKEVYDGLCDQSMQLWTWKDPETTAAMVTAIQTDNVKFCLILALGGRGMELWLQYLPIVEKWAIEKGCEQVRIYGRPGWSRKIGYEIEYCKMVKRLQNV